MLLKRSSLPSSDLHNNASLQLFGGYQDENIISCIGIEIYGNRALLRSLAVDERHRNKGIGKELLKYLENFCRENGVTEVFLLTETAKPYFETFGYVTHTREDAPPSIKGSTQFSGLCPVTSTLMRKKITGH